MFNADDFLSTNVSGKMDTQLLPVPEGYYRAVLTDKLEVSEFKGKKGNTFTKLSVWWIPSHPKLASILKREGVTVRQDIFLDVIRDSSGKIRSLELGPGKNVGLGQLREAVGQNDESKPWNIRNLIGRMAIIRVEHNKLEDGTIFSRVRSVHAQVPEGSTEGPFTA